MGIPLTNNPYLEVNNLQMAWVSNTTLSVAAGQARDSTNVYDIVLSEAVTINAAINGINGLDTGTLAASTTYAIYVINDSSGFNPVGTILSLSATTPYLPTGYDSFRRIGWAFTDGSTHFRNFIQIGNNNEREYQFDDGVQVLLDGADTSFADVDLSLAVPVIPSKVSIFILYTPDSAGNLATFRDGNSSNANGIFYVLGQVDTVQISVLQTMSCTTKEISSVESPAIQYKVSNSDDTLTLYVIGFSDSL